MQSAQALQLWRVLPSTCSVTTAVAEPARQVSCCEQWQQMHVDGRSNSYAQLMLLAAGRVSQLQNAFTGVTSVVLMIKACMHTSNSVGSL